MCNNKSRLTYGPGSKKQLPSGPGRPGRPNKASDNTDKILLSNRSTIADKLYMLKNAFCPVGKAAMVFDFLTCCTANLTYISDIKTISNIFMAVNKFIQKVAKAFTVYTVLHFLRLSKLGVGKLSKTKNTGD